MVITSRTTKVRLECSLQRSGGDLLCGHTRALSRDSVEIESNGFCIPGKRQPNAGELGVLTLKFLKGNRVETLQIMSRIVYIMGMTASLDMFMTDLSSIQRDDLLKIMETGSARID